MIFTKVKLICLLSILLSCGGIGTGNSQQTVSRELRLVSMDEIQTGAEQTRLYFPMLQGKKLGICCNHTSIVNGRHLIDTLVDKGFRVKKIFSPEHGFRGEAADGDLIKDGTDPTTGTLIISLYGNKKKPEPVDLQGIDLMIFDIQDVGARFYTYLSTLALVMEACAEQEIPMLVLDRPNPNGFYIDGPVLDTVLRSFVGMHPVPVVYGMTIGEYALMVNGEGWLAGGIRCNLQVIPLSGWDRRMIVRLPVRPSPNLPTWQSVYLYPSLCLFEGTVVSVGRGTEYPFQVIGHPDMMTGSYVFTPESIRGVSENPPLKGKICYGQNLTGVAENFTANEYHFTLKYLTGYFESLSMHDLFFSNYFEKLAGVKELRIQILNGMSEEDIRNSWQKDLEDFSKVRKKYLIYPDLD